jgi:hypothetical protein
VAADSYGDGNDGQFVDTGGVPPTWTDGVIGGGVQFSQAGWIDTAEPIIIGEASFSLGAWVKPAAEQTAFANIMSSHAEPPRRGISFERNNSDGEPNSYGVAMGTGENWTGCGDWGFLLTPDEWVHIVATRSADGTAGNSYINGVPVLVDGECSHVEPIGDAEQPFRLGSWVLAENARAWNGVLDEPFVMNRTLSADDVTSIYNDGWAVSLGDGGAAVDPSGKVSTVWANIKTR